MHRLQQLHEGRFAILWRNFPLAITGDDLAEQRDLHDAAPGQLAALGDNIRNRPAPFCAPRVRYDAERAILVAPLHDAHVSRDRRLRLAAERSAEHTPELQSRLPT